MRKIAIVLVGTMVIAIAALVTAFILSKPEPPETIPSDLQVIRYNIPAESNAFTYFLRATNYMFSYSPTSEASKRIWAILGEFTNWDAQLAFDYIQSNELALAEIDRGLACERCQFPQVTNSEWWTVYSFVAWRNLSYVMCLKAHCLSDSGRGNEALGQILKSLRFGKMVEDGPGYFFTYAAGLGIKGMALNEAERVTTSRSLPSRDLLSYASALSVYESDPEAFRNAARNLYAFEYKNIDDLARGTYTNMYGTDFWEARGTKILLRISYFFQPERTKQLLTQTCRTWIRNADRTFDEIGHDITATDGGDRSVLSIGNVRPNMLGRLIPESLAGSSRSVRKYGYKTDATLRCCQLLLVLKAYKQDHGNLPETLDVLVPGYLGQVPADPFDGRPMRYSPDKKIVYSISENLKDDGGTEARPDAKTARERYNSRWSGPDLVFKADF